MTATLTNYGSLTATVDATQLADDITGSVPAQTGTMTDTFPNAGLGDTILWYLSYKVDQSAPASQAPAVTVAGVPYGVVFGVPTGPCPQYGIVPINNAIDALITGTAPPPGNADTLVVTYPFVYEAKLRVADPAPQTAYAAVANRGVFQAQIGNSASNLSLAQAAASIEAQLRQYSTPFTTLDALIGEYYQGTGVEEGQAISFTSNRLGLLGLLAVIMSATWSGSVGFDQKTLELSMDVQN